MISTSIATDLGLVSIRCTTVGDGDFALSTSPQTLSSNRSRLCDRPWTWLRQVHGSDVVTVGTPGEHAGAQADSAVSNRTDVALSVITADCAPLALVGTNGFAVVHAGWRGLSAGVVNNAAKALSDMSSGPIAAVLGPCIHPQNYEFSESDLEPLVARFGASVAGRTSTGSVALDLPALVASACEQAGWPAPRFVDSSGFRTTSGVESAAVWSDNDDGMCTSGSRFFSHRVRADTGRQTMVGWIES